MQNTITRDKIRYFRALRQFMIPRVMESSCTQESAIMEVCSRILGAQGQVESAAALAISIRCHSDSFSCPISIVLSGVKPSISNEGDYKIMPYLVRCWGQRGTLHMYSKDDWFNIIQARRGWSKSGRTGLSPSEKVAQDIRKLFETSNKPLPASKVLEHLPDEYIDRVKEHLKQKKIDLKVEGVASRRTIFKLVLRGHVCHATKKGQTQLYVARKVWFPELNWPIETESKEDIECQDNGNVFDVHLPMIKRYFYGFGPATVRDVAHYFGSTLRNARLWIKELLETNEITIIKCSDRFNDDSTSTGVKDDLLILSDDLEQLNNLDVPSLDENELWPLIFLPLYDTTLMGYADKSWMVPFEVDRKEVWKKAAYVSSVCLWRGTIVATYTHNIKKSKDIKHLRINILCLSQWNDSIHRDAVLNEANRLKDILECDNVELDFV